MTEAEKRTAFWAIYHRLSLGEIANNEGRFALVIEDTLRGLFDSAESAAAANKTSYPHIIKRIDMDEVNCIYLDENLFRSGSDSHGATVRGQSTLYEAEKFRTLASRYASAAEFGYFVLDKLLESKDQKERDTFKARLFLNAETISDTRDKLIAALGNGDQSVAFVRVFGWLPTRQSFSQVERAVIALRAGDGTPRIELHPVALYGLGSIADEKSRLGVSHPGDSDPPDLLANLSIEELQLELQSIPGTTEMLHLLGVDSFGKFQEVK